MVIEKIKGEKVVMLVEDVHFFDNDSWQFLHELALKFCSTHLLFLYTRYMQHPPSEFGQLCNMAKVMELTPLNKDEIAELLKRKFDQSFPDKVIEYIDEHSDGTPFWVNQLADVVGKYSDKTGEELEVLLGNLSASDQLEQSIMTQFDQLSKQQQEILKFASILGTSFDTIILKEILPMSIRRKVDIMDEIDRLVDEGFLTAGGSGKSGLNRGVEDMEDDENCLYCFSHDLLQRVVVELTPTTQQSKRHRQVAQVYEELYSEDLRPYLMHLAHHYDRGGQRYKSFTYLKLSALSALQTDAVEHGTLLLKRALLTLNGAEPAEQLSRVVELDLMLKTCLLEAGIPEHMFAQPDVEKDGKRAKLLLKKKKKKAKEKLTAKEQLSITKYRELLVFSEYLSKTQGGMEAAPTTQLDFDEEEIQAWCRKAKAEADDGVTCGDGKDQTSASAVCVVL